MGKWISWWFFIAWLEIEMLWIDRKQRGSGKQPQKSTRAEAKTQDDGQAKSIFASVDTKDREDIEEQAQENPNNVDALLRYAILLAMEKKDAEALVNLQKAVELDADRSDVWLAYAEFYERKNDPKKAQEIYSQGYKHASPKIALGGDDSELMLQYAVNCQNSKDYDKAEKLFKRVVTSGPRNPRGLGLYATFLQQVRKNIEKAGTYYKQAADVDPPSAHWTHQYAIFLRDTIRNESEANVYFKKSSLII
eukprot:gene8995-10551_t